MTKNITKEELKEIIKNKIHNLSTNNKMYSILYGIDKLESHSNYKFNFSIAKTTNIDNVDIGFFLDNIIAKMIYQNYDNKDLPKITVDSDTKNITVDGEKFTNPFVQHIVDLGEHRLCDIENYIDDIEVSISDEYIHIELELPIYMI